MSLAARLQAILERHRQFAMLVVLFLTLRALAVPLLAPGGLITGAGPDDHYYLNFAALSSAGYYPFLDYWSDYPPVFPWVAVLAYRLSLSVPAWSNPLLPFTAILRWGMVPFDVGCLVLTYAIARHLYQQSQAEWIATAYAVSFVPLFVLLAWFDTLALFFLLLGLWGMVRQRPVASGLGIGMGFLTKALPLVALPAAAQVFRRWPRWLWLSLTLVVVVVGVLGTLFALSPEYTLATIKAPASGTPPYETVWALLDGVIDFGIVAPLNERIDPAAAVRPFESRLPWFWITLVFAALGVFLWTRHIDWGDPQRSLAFVGLTWGLTLLYSKGFSPQWHLYTLALALLCLPGWRGVLYSVVLSALLVWEWPLAYYVFRAASWVAVTVIVLRTLLTIALTLDFAAQVFPAQRRLARIARLAFPVAVEIAVVAAIALTPGMLRAYQRIRAEEDTLAPLIETIREDAGARQAVVTPHHELVGRLAAPLRGAAAVLLLPQVYDDAWEEPEVWLAERAQAYERVWLVVHENDGPAPTLGGRMQTWLDERWCLTHEFSTSDGLLVRGYDPAAGSSGCPPPQSTGAGEP